MGFGALGSEAQAPGPKDCMSCVLAKLVNRLFNLETFKALCQAWLWAGHRETNEGNPVPAWGGHASDLCQHSNCGGTRAPGHGQGPQLRDSGCSGPSDQGSRDWQQHEAEPPAPSAHSLEAQASLTAAPSAPAPWTSPDEAPSWANPEGAASCQSLHAALPPSPALRMGLLLAPPVSPKDPCLFCSISG